MRTWNAFFRKHYQPQRNQRDRCSGVALVLVLCFVVLLSALVLALLARSTSSGLISNASANFTRTDLYGQGAINQVLGDLRQEVVDGSTAPATPVSTNASGYVSYIYRPVSATNAVPALAGPVSYGSPSSAGSDWNMTFPNLVKESTHAVSFYTYSSSGSTTIPDRAAPVSTSTDSMSSGSASGLSRNGRFVSLAEWNKALLLPKKSASVTPGTGGSSTTLSDSATLDTTPNADFIAPDWVLTAVDGSNPTALDNSPSLTTSNVNPQSPKFVVGRYAYTIYNEGGLLDANVAGSPEGYGPTYPPSNLGSGAGSGGGPSEQTIWSRKGPESFADLTVLPGIAQVSSVTPQQVSDDIVGWRNSATAQPSGSFPSYMFGRTGIDSYFSYLLGLSTRFMTVGSLNKVSDRTFTSRQQLISFLQDLAPSGDTADQAYLQDAMMYLGTFSRSLNQPSYWPDPNRPKIVAGAATAGGSAPGTTASYSGGNSAYQNDNSFNPIFKSIRVLNTFVRPAGPTNDSSLNPDGTTAIVGEPLVKKRFPLSLLCWITYKGPSADLYQSNPGDPEITALLNDGVPLELIKEGTDANILNYFGLTWTSGTYAGNITPTTISYWVYGHPATPNASKNLVGLLSDAQAANREPDFFELLQSSVNAGAIALSYTGQGGTETVTPFLPVIDSQIAVQILQMGANIIDQANPTEFPTHIEYTFPAVPAGLVSGVYSVFGQQDLPYLNSTHDVSFIVQPSSSSVAPGASTTPADPTLTPNSPQGGGKQGEGVFMVVPSIWNPYDVNSPAPVAGIEPVNLRITLLGGSPVGTPDLTSYLTLTPSSALTPPPGSTSTSTTVSTTTVPPANPWTVDDSACLLFTNPAHGLSLYREPTPLLVAQAFGTNYLKIPGDSYLNSKGDATEAGSGKTFVGFLAATFPSQWNGSASVTKAGVTSTQTFTFTTDRFTFAKPPHGYTFRFEYQDPATSQWVPYAEYFRSNVSEEDFFPQKEDGSAQYPYLLPASTTPTAGPPASSLWDVGGTIPTPSDGVSGPSADYAWDPRTSRWGMPDDLRSVATPIDPTGVSIPTIQASTTPGPGGTTGGGEQHPPPAPFLGPTGSMFFSTAQQNIFTYGTYYSDPDGIVRRAMGGYQSTGSSTVGLPLATAAGNATNLSNRPVFLHRPYRSVAELGYVFSDTPWRNIDFFTPESGYSALLDTFCIDEDYRPDAVRAGRVDLNTKQAPVIQALLAGAYRDETGQVANSSLTTTEAATVAQDLVKRTSVGGTNPNYPKIAPGPQPLSNIADLVGRWVGSSASFSATSPGNGPALYDGFSADLGPLYTGGKTSANGLIQRFRESTMRALSDAGQAGTWNLLIDVVAQSGRYPANATGLSDFLVEGQHHYWVHVAIDRTTDQVIDEKIEVVNE